jgi:hypothetical protein
VVHGHPTVSANHGGAETPFVLISPTSELGKAILARNHEYDLIAEHATASTAEEGHAEVVLLRQPPGLITALKMLLMYLLTIDDGLLGRASDSTIRTALRPTLLGGKCGRALFEDSLLH